MGGRVNPEERREYHKLYCRKWRAKNLEKVRAQSRKYEKAKRKRSYGTGLRNKDPKKYKAFMERLRLYTKKWRKDNKEKYQAQLKRWYKKRREKRGLNPEIERARKNASYHKNHPTAAIRAAARDLARGVISPEDLQKKLDWAIIRAEEITKA